MDKRLVASIFALGAILTACGEVVTAAPTATQEATPVATATPAPTVTVKVDGFYSALQSTTVKVGTTVKFVPAGDYQVMLVGDLSSPLFGAAGHVVTFDKPGTFSWRSGLQAGCHGRVVVVP